MANIINISNGASTAVERSNLYNLFMADIRNIPLLTKEQELKLLERYHNSESSEEKRDIRDILLKHNQRFVVGAAKQFADNDVDTLLDLISEGNIGFMSAIDSYDTSKKIKLISWAAWYIRRAMNIYLYRNKEMVRQSYDGIMYHQRIKARNILTQKLQREVMDDEIFEYLSEEKKLPVSDVSDIRQVQVDSIDSANLNDDDEFNTVMSEYNATTANANGCEQELDNYDNKELLKLAMVVLDNREKEVFNMLYGLDGRAVEDTMETVAERFSCSKERIRQIHAKGLMKMKEKLENCLELI